MAKPSASESELVTLLRKRYPEGEYALMAGVRNGTGYQRTARTADAVAMSCWPSRGLRLMGFECKSSRGDWLAEKRDPEKSADIQRFCDEWWIVAGNDAIVEASELPATWGLLVARNGKLVQAREAPKLEALPIDRLFLAALLRAATTGVVPQAEVASAVALRIAEREKGWRESNEFELRALRKRIGESEEKWALFQKESGISVYDKWQAGKIGKAVAFVLNGGLERDRGRIETERDRLRAAAAALDEVLAKDPP